MVEAINGATTEEGAFVQGNMLQAGAFNYTLNLSLIHISLSVRAIRCPLYLLTGLISVSKNGLWYCELQSHYTVVLLLLSLIHI